MPRINIVLTRAEKKVVVDGVDVTSCVNRIELISQVGEPSCVVLYLPSESTIVEVDAEMATTLGLPPGSKLLKGHERKPAASLAESMEMKLLLKSLLDEQ